MNIKQVMTLSLAGFVLGNSVFTQNTKANEEEHQNREPSSEEKQPEHHETIEQQGHADHYGAPSH